MYSPNNRDMIVQSVHVSVIASTRRVRGNLTVLLLYDWRTVGEERWDCLAMLAMNDPNIYSQVLRLRKCGGF